MNYRKEIDGLRAVAVVPVILFHAGFEVFGGGFVGVDVFFVISGYLITDIIIRELDQGTFSIARFYERRARRILPALVLVTSCCVPFAFLWMTPFQLYDFSESLVAVALFVSNFQFWRDSGYFDDSGEEEPLLHTWSLAVEEQYYLLFPVLLIFAWKFGRNPTFYLVLLITISSLIFSEIAWRKVPSANFFLLPSRIWELTSGSICAFIGVSREPKFRHSLSSIGLVLVAVGILFFDENTPFPSLLTLAPVLGTGLVILYGTQGTWVAKLLSTKGFVGIGLISYSAYLWHYPIFAFASIRGSSDPQMWFLTALVSMSFLLAYLSWRFVEQPFRKGEFAQALPRLRVYTISIVALVFLTSLGSLGMTNNGLGFSAKTNEIYKEYIQTAQPSPRRGRCVSSWENYVDPADACEYFSSNVAYAILGDSHTIELSYALAQSLRSRDIGLKQMSFAGCPPRLESEDQDDVCLKWLADALDYILSNDSIQNVVVSYRIHFWLFGEHDKVWPELPNTVSEEERAQNLDAYFDLVEVLVESGKNVVLVLQAPELRAPIQKMVYQQKDFVGPIVGVPKTWWDSRSRYFNENRRDLPKKVLVIDPSEFLCDEEACYAGRDGTSFYFDSDHLSVMGAGIIATKIVEGHSVALLKQPD